MTECSCLSLVYILFLFFFYMECACQLLLSISWIRVVMCCRSRFSARLALSCRVFHGLELPQHSMRARCRVLCCLVLSSVVLPFPSIRGIRGGDQCYVVFCFVRLVLSSRGLAYSIQKPCVLHPCVESLRLREMSRKAIRSI